MPSPLPTLPLYQEAIQNPRVCFKDVELSKCVVETDPMHGLPRVRSGGFAITYKLKKPGTQIAVRCFHRHIPDRERRYQAVSRFIQQHPSSIFIPITYVPDGIRVQGQWYPITFMPWVEGDTLVTLLDRNHQNQPLIVSLLKEFERLVDELTRLDIAHGDLSGANIIIKDNRMVLIDYDGMFVPELRGLQSNELGNIHFQHPGRTPYHFDTKVDRFSCLVIYLSLQALSRKPSLWKQYGNGEGLLFTRKDFDAPYSSAVLKELEQYPDLKPLAIKFRHVCQASYSNVPSLADFLSGQPYEITENNLQKDFQANYVPQYPVFDYKSKQTILRHEGEMVEVVGKIIKVVPYVLRRGPSIGKTCVFLNFGVYGSHSFYLVAWPETVSLFSTLGMPPTVFVDSWVSVTGIISTYEGAPQIVVESPKQIELLTGEDEARNRIKAYQERGISSSVFSQVEENATPRADHHLNQQLPPPKVDEPKVFTSAGVSDRVNALFSDQPVKPTGVNNQVAGSTNPNILPISPQALPSKQPVQQLNQAELNKRLNDLYSGPNAPKPIQNSSTQPLNTPIAAVPLKTTLPPKPAQTGSTNQRPPVQGVTKPSSPATSPAKQPSRPTASTASKQQKKSVFQTLKDFLEKMFS